MKNKNQNPEEGRAFISCSLKAEDDPFVRFVEEIVLANGFTPFGTVGRHDASPENPAELMRKNIPDADILVIAATARYLQEDMFSGTAKRSISEMLHVESGIAYAWNKPIIVLAESGTDLGNFLPNITQYITLDGTQHDLELKWPLINQLFDNAWAIINISRQQESTAGLKKFFVGGLALFGAVKFGEYLFDA